MDSFLSNDDKPPTPSVIHQPLHAPSDDISLLHSQGGISRDYGDAFPNAESFDIMSVTSSSTLQRRLLNQTNFGNLQMEIGALLLTTLLALGAALDARNECIDQEMYAWMMNLGDDDEVGGNDDYAYNGFDADEGRFECLSMFQHVIVPTVTSTFALGPLALYIIQRRTTYLATTSEDYVPSNLGTLLRLLVPFLGIFLSWTYANFSIMIKPRVDPGLYNQNPFKSLAAVDSMGRVGGNANLYYMSWISHAISLILVYRVVVDVFRAWGSRRPSAAIEQVGSFTETINLHEQIQKMLAFTSAKQLASIYKKRRRKWYQFLLHLRERSGYWVAAFFSSLVLFGGSLSVFVEVLVNLASTTLGSDDFGYHDVCAIVAGSSELPEEYCIRTAYAVVTGPLALYIIQRRTTYLATTSEDYVPSNLGTLLRLLVPFLGIFLSWTYANFSIMIKPRVDPGLYNQNPFKSLAAVDSMGRVGGNANLYYMSWISHAISLILVYRVVVDVFRAWGSRRPSAAIEQVGSFTETINLHEQIQKMLAFTSAKQLASIYKKRRRKWYQFLLHLRERSGYWVAAFFSSLVLFGGSLSVFVEVLVNLASTTLGSDDFGYHDVCAIVAGSSELPEEYCIRTAYAVVTGAVAVIFCLFAMTLHIFVRRKAAKDEQARGNCTIMATEIMPGALDLETTKFHLGLEFLTSFCLSILLGLNAVFATGVQGPAVTVGNLYYASWASFLLCLRICLGCVEEIYNVKPPSSVIDGQSASLKTVPEEKESQTSSNGSDLPVDMDYYKKVAKVERPSRLRKYFFLCIFSLVCSAAAWDAAYNQDEECTTEQKFIIFAPALVAAISIVLFLLCLKSELYTMASHICIGGIMSIVCFLLLLADIVMLMHSEDSWAVNGIGEMKLANLYYFSWASIITAALQMVSYVKPLLGPKSKDAMFLVWASMVKVCMVILGAASHVWYKISDTCVADEKEDGDVTFCRRTTFALIVGAVGVISGWTVMAARLIGCLSSRTRNRAEAGLSIFLVISFGIAVAVITSIGGPGQSVGDLYYATWLSFWVSIGISISCYDQIKQEDIQATNNEYEETGVDGAYVDIAVLENTGNN